MPEVIQFEDLPKSDIDQFINLTLRVQELEDAVTNGDDALARSSNVRSLSGVARQLGRFESDLARRGIELSCGRYSLEYLITSPDDLDDFNVLSESDIDAIINNFKVGRIIRPPVYRYNENDDEYMLVSPGIVEARDVSQSNQTDLRRD